MSDFLWGALSFAGGVIGLFFLRSWRTTHDRLFIIFAIAFWLMSIQWVAVAATRAIFDTQYYLYLIRLLAFILIAVAILDKNRTTKNRG
jgi:hypothetical protein